MSAAAVSEAAQEHIHPDRMLVVVVGDATQIYDKVAKFGDVELFDVEGNPIGLEDLEVKAASVELDPSTIEPVTLVYSLIFQGNPVGELTTQVSRQTRDGREVIESQTTGAAMTMTIEQRVVFDARTFDGIESHVSQKMGAQGIGIELTKQGDTISGTVTGMGGQTQEIDVEVPPGTLLPGMDDFALWVAELESGAEIDLPAFSALGGQPYTLKLKVTGEETLTTPAGEFDAYRIESSGAQGNAAILVRKAAPHYVLRQEPGGQPIVIELKEIR